MLAFDVDLHAAAMIRVDSVAQLGWRHKSGDCCWLRSVLRIFSEYFTSTERPLTLIRVHIDRPPKYGRRLHIGSLHAVWVAFQLYVRPSLHAMSFNGPL